MSQSRVALAALATLARLHARAVRQRRRSPHRRRPPSNSSSRIPAGGLPDTVARIVGRRMQERLNQTIVVENRSGANGGIAVNRADQRARRRHDLRGDRRRDPVDQSAALFQASVQSEGCAPIAALATAPLFLAVHPSVPVATMKEFIAHVKANPGKYNIGSSGVGSIHHISLEALKLGLGLNITHIPYKGTGEAVPALLGGHVQMLFSAYPSLAGAAGTKRITLLATNGATRSSQAPDLPAISEFIPGFSYAPFVGIYARVGTPAGVIEKIAAEAMAIVKEPEVIKQLAKVGVEPIGGDAAEFRTLPRRRDRARRQGGQGRQHQGGVRSGRGLPPRPRQRMHPALHARLGVLDVLLGEELLRLHLVDRIDRPQEVALVAERHRGIDAHAALELRVRRGPLLVARGHALGRHEGLAAPARDRIEDVGAADSRAWSGTT